MGHVNSDNELGNRPGLDKSDIKGHGIEID